MEHNKKKKRQDFFDILKKAGFRLTNQRQTIIDVLIEGEAEHGNIQLIWEKAHEKDPSIGIATVYRTVGLLSDMGLLYRFSLDEGFERFELPSSSIHFHLYCRCCGKVLHLKHEREKEEIITEWLGEAGFQPIPQSLEFAGMCSDCASKVKDHKKMKDLPCTLEVEGRGRGRGRCGRRQGCFRQQNNTTL
ncbi:MULTISPECIES: Fur family transcriptional regulator [Aminobacterium]|jgi:Fur family ferric uptake transcriptional regulator|uniref:Ferric uptake regulator, Fur family n=1 Tax=Aminobacterium colombiense (strain DSM 12261 / ALA-1) TaxID=572547 RepID=D5EC87_AMICL|nr:MULTISPECIES: Fur family transcriptional regulator [Aminobacterium]MDD2378983.1 Fur family transcriptional regulator [Aminobacterium colombiense]ADE56169.1 ferric uptake regulator, Fur family [Aminobacterium colombiense DSM 12261]MDD3767516.1 Fur family transcriptional regulator [Aminobacterium colombiense]MDD4265572.1 Fur family transcriptional regulator [Aminobacterium colombiense]MDD4585814.1 Fur family transcriptional regulator [Aminobacterium colombiense]